LPSLVRWLRQVAISVLAETNSVYFSGQTVEINVQPVDCDDREQVACANAHRGIAHACLVLAFSDQPRNPEQIKSIAQKTADAQADAAV
jgi:hypothetical protein